VQASERIKNWKLIDVEKHRFSFCVALRLRKEGLLSQHAEAVLTHDDMIDLQVNCSDHFVGKASSEGEPLPKLAPPYKTVMKTSDKGRDVKDDFKSSRAVLSQKLNEYMHLRHIDGNQLFKKNPRALLNELRQHLANSNLSLKLRLTTDRSNLAESLFETTIFWDSLQWKGLATRKVTATDEAIRTMLKDIVRLNRLI